MVLRWCAARAVSATKSVDDNEDDDESGHRVNDEDTDQIIEASREHGIEFIQSLFSKTLQG